MHAPSEFSKNLLTCSAASSCSTAFFRAFYLRGCESLPLGTEVQTSSSIDALKKENALDEATSMIVKLKTSRMFISSSSSHRPADNRPWFGNEVGQFPHSTNKTFMVPHPGAGHLANGY